MIINKKIYFSLAIIFLLNLILIIISYLIFNGIVKDSEELSLQKDKIVSLTKQIQEQEKAFLLYRIYQKDFKDIENAFIEPDIPVEFVKFLEETASSSNIQLEISSASKIITKEDLWPSLHFQLSLEGPTSNFLKFLEQVELSPYITEVLDLTLNDKTANMTIKVFTK